MKKGNKVIQDKFKLFMILTIAYAVFIFYLSSLSSPPSPSDLGFLRGFLRESIQLLEDLGLKFLIYPFYLIYLYPDKFEHLILYMFFGLLLHLTIRNSRNFSKYASSFSVLIGTLYGISDEIHQFFVPFRSPSATDLLADFLGLILAQFLFFSYKNVAKKASSFRAGMN